jgi:F0F1-type ATP synthase membrane subunit b/b'
MDLHGFFVTLWSKNYTAMSKSKNPLSEATNSSTSLESTQRLEAIKNLIFGENIQQIDQDFTSLKNLIDKRKEELENYIEETRKELNHTIDNLATDINIRITDLENNLNQKVEDLDHKKLDRNVLGTLLVSLGEKIMKD